MRLPDFVTPIVGNNLFRLRRAARLTRPALAARIKLLPHRCVSPLSVASLTQLERGQRQSITSDEVAVLATVLHVPASTLTKASTVVAPFAPPDTDAPDREVADDQTAGSGSRARSVERHDWSLDSRGQFPAGHPDRPERRRLRPRRDSRLAGDAAGAAQGGGDADDLKRKTAGGADPRPFDVAAARHSEPRNPFRVSRGRRRTQVRWR